MRSNNDASSIRLKVLAGVADALLKGDRSELDRIPVKLRPRGKDFSRCCLYYDRAVLRYRVMGALGHSVEEETDEAQLLSSLPHRANKNNKILSVIDIACDGCRHGAYMVTNACRGCLARPCITNCPKNAVSIVNGRAVIDQDLCISCGKCRKLCAFQAIVNIEVPCETACPVGAISRAEDGRQVIDHDRCIYCGRCLQKCPFAAIMEISSMTAVIQAMMNGEKVIAMVAPAIEKQFPGTLQQILTSLLEVGFSDVVEVASGAELTMKHEREELVEKFSEGKLLTTSCCPAYATAVEKHLPELKHAISSTPSPMNYSAKTVKSSDPEAVTVFIGPCLAKRNEAIKDENVDFVMTFEELGALMVAKGVFVAEQDGPDTETPADERARLFRAVGGVSQAVMSELDDEFKEKLKTKIINGLDKKSLKQLSLYGKGKIPADFIEVMACEGGCVNGPCGFSPLTIAK